MDDPLDVCIVVYSHILYVLFVLHSPILIFLNLFISLFMYVYYLITDEDAHDMSLSQKYDKFGVSALDAATVSQIKVFTPSFSFLFLLSFLFFLLPSSLLLFPSSSNFNTYMKDELRLRDEKLSGKKAELIGNPFKQICIHISFFFLHTSFLLCPFPSFLLFPLSSLASLNRIKQLHIDVYLRTIGTKHIAAETPRTGI